METPLAYPTTAVKTTSHAKRREIDIPQYGRRKIFATWAAATLPMAALAWLVAPRLADHLSGPGHVPLAKALILTLTLGLIWQFVLVAVLVAREQGTLRWSVTREALWLRSPRNPKNGRIGGRVWLIVIPLSLAFGVEGLLIPSLPHSDNRDLGAFLATHNGQAFMHGAWAWYGVLLVCFLFNTVLGEELLFRGLLLPRMNGAFGRGDWVANGLLFAAYHLHTPWVIPATLLDTFIIAYPSKRYRSAWMGIAIHSSQSIFFAIIGLSLVL
jgi:membrane protease YdiL (CAAX protease family)